MQLILFGILALAGSLTPGSPWPVMQGETLSGAKLRLPDAAKDRPAVVLMTFSRDAGNAARPWYARFAKDFGPDRLYQVVMLERAPRLVRGLIRSGMRSDMPQAVQAHTLLLYTEDAEWRSRLGITNDALPCIVMLNGDSRIAWIHQGNFDETQYQKLKPNAL